jgi:soluble lytic murein transglycosylase-like protein
MRAGLSAAMCTLAGAGLVALSPLAAAAAAGSSTHDTSTAPDSALAAQVARAIAYEHGEGIPKDQKIAAALYCDAAVRGSAEAAFQLGWMYANGRGVEHDDGIAVALFALAASEGHPFAARARANIAGPPSPLPECMRPLAPPDIPRVDLADAADARNPFDDLPADKKRIVEVVRSLAPRYGIDPRLALSIIAVESNFDVFARSLKNAQGLMQLIPETAARFNVRKPFDIEDNLRGGLSYLRWLLAYYRGEVALAAAAYNAGEGTVDRYRGVPPFPETRAYVRRVLAMFRRERHPYDPAVVEPSVIAARLGTAAH